MITFHKATVNEVHEIKKLLFDSWSVTYADIFSPETIALITSEWHSPELLIKQIEDPFMFFEIAKDDHQIVGMGNASLSDKQTINLQRLHVTPEYKGKGIGTGLLERASKHFPDATTIEVEVEKQNHLALTFYKKNGFKETGEKTFTVQNEQIPCFIMKKSLLSGYSVV